MEVDADRPPSVATLLRELGAVGATHVVGIPDNGSAPLFDRLSATTVPRLVRVTREGEAFSIAAGLWIGGATPIVAIQNTGLLESGDALRGTVVRMGVPLLMLIGYRGYASLATAAPRSYPSQGAAAGELRADPSQAGAAAGLPGAEDLRRHDVDSVALLTEPTLYAWRLPFEHLDCETDLSKVGGAWRRACAESRPVALLQTRGLVE